MSTVGEIQQAIAKLPRTEVEALRDWIEDFLEGGLELSDQAIAMVEQSNREIATGQFSTR